MNYPRISLVTPTFNRADFLEHAIKSVVDQGYPNLEYIVIDAKSRDNSVDIIRKYSDHIAYWVSEPDKGQADALRKGFARATGDLLNWLNSDDLLMPGALHAVAEAYQKNPGHIIAGNALVSYDSGKANRVFVSAGMTFEEAIKSWLVSCTYSQPSAFFPRAAYEKMGGIRVECEYVMDWDLLFRLLLECPVTYIDNVLSHIQLHQACKTVGEAWRGVLVRRYAARDYWSHLPGGYKPSYKVMQALDLVRVAGGRVRDRNWTSAVKILQEPVKKRFWQSDGLSNELAFALCRGR